MYLLSAIINTLGGIIFIIFGQGTVQPFNNYWEIAKDDESVVEEQHSAKQPGPASEQKEDYQEQTRDNKSAPEEPCSIQPNVASGETDDYWEQTRDEDL